jgi:hypothetical protein
MAKEAHRSDHGPSDRLAPAPGLGRSRLRPATGKTPSETRPVFVLRRIADDGGRSGRAGPRPVVLAERHDRARERQPAPPKIPVVTHHEPCA